jgi:hypothetical protein
MKKIILFAAVAVAVIGTSCRKELTCECTSTNTTVTTVGGNSTTTTSTSSYKVTKASQKKKDFRLTEGCYGTKDTYTNTFTGGTSVTTSDQTCEVK